MVNYYCDGIRVSEDGLVFCAMGAGLDVLDEEGMTQGRIRTQSKSEDPAAVNTAFCDMKELWVVGRGGIWRITGIKEELRREW